MAEVFLTLNGIGSGHLVRATQACGWLRRSHKRPVIFFQGSYPPDVASRYPGVQIPTLYKLPPATAQIIANDVAKYAHQSEPAVIIEDTHPAPVVWPASVNTFLMVRPTKFEYMLLLNQHHGTRYKRFIVCDHPDSPSWPYSAAQTSEILRWGNWQCIGPIFRSATRHGIEQVKNRHQLLDDEQVFVFSMGGGGERPGTNDRMNFLRETERLASEIRDHFPRPRLLFVCGPLFPQDLSIPNGLEVIREEPELPSLFHVAFGAIIRPGFNTMWECIAAGTPFLPILGTTYMEPVDQRIERMQCLGLDASRSFEHWLDDHWRSNYKKACRLVLDKFSGAPSAEFTQAIRHGLADTGSRTISNWPNEVRTRRNPDVFDDLKTSLMTVNGPKRLIIRLDDVVDDGRAVDWLVSVCRERGLFVSLEIIPYLVGLSRRRLDLLDKDEICEVSQHGYSHLPQRAQSGGKFLKGEFVSEQLYPSNVTMISLRRGKRLLSKMFGKRFKGGYSAPYDGLPPWLPVFWRNIGGEYISWIGTPPDASNIHQVRVGLDVWDWRASTEKPINIIKSHSIQAIRNRGVIGLVLHPQCLENSSHRENVECLIDALMQGGCKGAFISEVAKESTNVGVFQVNSLISKPFI